MTIPEQLVKIYNEEEKWHTSRMNYTEALDYHRSRYENGDIQTYIENGEVFGYYERYFTNNTCILYNIWIKDGFRRSKVMKELKHRFFSTMPKHITDIIGEKQKLGGKVMKAIIRRR